MPERQWELPEWFKDPERRHLWLFQNVKEDNATLSALVKVVEQLVEDVEDCKQKETVNQAETNRKLDTLIEFLKPFTNLHDSSIQQRQTLTAVTPQGTAIQQTTTISAAPANLIQWAIANPGKALILAGSVGIPALITVGKTLVWVIQLAASYGK